MVALVALMVLAWPQAIGITRDAESEMLVLGYAKDYQVLYRFKNDQESWLSWFDVSRNGRYVLLVVNNQSTLLILDLAAGGKTVRKIDLGDGALNMPWWREDGLVFASVKNVKDSEAVDIQMYRARPPAFKLEDLGHTPHYLVASRKLLLTPKNIGVIGLPAPERKVLTMYAELSGIRVPGGATFLFPELRKTIYSEHQPLAPPNQKLTEWRYFVYDWGSKRSRLLFATTSEIRMSRRIGYTSFGVTVVPNENKNVRWNVHGLASGSPYTDLSAGPAAEAYVSMVFDLKSGATLAIPGLVGAVPSEFAVAGKPKVQVPK